MDRQCGYVLLNVNCEIVLKVNGIDSIEGLPGRRSVGTLLSCMHSSSRAIHSSTRHPMKRNRYQ